MSELYNLFPTPPWATSLALFALAILILYMGRESAHGAIRSFFNLLSGSLRLGARSVANTAFRLRERNREVLLALGREHAERELEREFFRINKFVERDLGGYPELQRSMHEQITIIDEDYRASGEVPLPSPEWIQAVESVAKLHLKERGNDLTAKILEDIYQGSEEQQREVLQAYRQSRAERHRILKRMTPYWRKLSNSVDLVGKHLEELLTRAKNIDHQMALFRDISEGSDKSEQMLKASAVTQFIVALLVVVIATGGAFFNFHLIALPMSEMVGAASRVGGVQVSDLAALVIIFLEITMGIFLLEALRVTKLFPIIGSMDDRMRTRMLWLFGSILLILASVESGLAFMRDQVAMDLAVLRNTLAGVEVYDQASNVNTWIPLAANMVMGFILPLALTVVAIPLEYLLNTGRTVMGMWIELMLRLTALVMRLLGNTCRHTGTLFINLYDILIVLPLWVESRWSKTSKNNQPLPANDPETVSATVKYYAQEVRK